MMTLPFELQIGIALPLRRVDKNPYFHDRRLLARFGFIPRSGCAVQATDHLLIRRAARAEAEAYSVATTSGAGRSIGQEAPSNRLRLNLANFCAVIGLPNKHPWIRSTPISRSTRKLFRFSTLSATVRAPERCAKSTI